MAPNVQLRPLRKSVKSAAVASRDVSSNLVINILILFFFLLHYALEYLALLHFIISPVKDCSVGCRKVVFLKYFFSKKTILNFTKIKLFSAHISVSRETLNLRQVD